MDNARKRKRVADQKCAHLYCLEDGPQIGKPRVEEESSIVTFATLYKKIQQNIRFWTTFWTKSSTKEQEILMTNIMMVSTGEILTKFSTTIQRKILLDLNGINR